MTPLATKAVEKILCFVLFLSISLEQDGGRGGKLGKRRERRTREEEHKNISKVRGEQQQVLVFLPYFPGLKSNPLVPAFI